VLATPSCSRALIVGQQQNAAGPLVVHAPSQIRNDDLGLGFDMDRDTYTRLDPLRRMPGPRYISSASKPLVKMVGMQAIGRLLWDVIAKPISAPDLYKTVFNRLSPLNFCIVGRNGFGKHTAIRRACMEWNVEVVTIRPHRCIQGDVAAAMHYAIHRKPCVVCFKAFDNLLLCDGFREEFRSQICGNVDICERWDNVWLAFCVETVATSETDIISTLCGPRIAHIEIPTKQALAHLFYNDFLCAGGIKVDPIPTDFEWLTLAGAAEGHTPAELRKFAGNVMYRALSKRSTKTLATISGVPTIPLGNFDGVSRPTTQQQQPSPELNTKMLLDAARTMPCGQVEYRRGEEEEDEEILPSSSSPLSAPAADAPLISSLEPQSSRNVLMLSSSSIEEQPTTPLTPTDGMIRISWHDDVESMYVKTPANVSGISKSTIPTYESKFITI